VYARASRVAIAQGLPTTHPGDALFNLITFSRTWIRPWAFYAIEDKSVRDTLLALFPDGCVVAFAGDTYCESRNETMDDCWRVMHALPGDGQNRPSVGDSLVQSRNATTRFQTFSRDVRVRHPADLCGTRKCSTSTRYRIRLPSLRRTIRAARPWAAACGRIFSTRRGAGSSGPGAASAGIDGTRGAISYGLFPLVFGGEMDSQKTASATRWREIRRLAG